MAPLLLSGGIARTFRRPPAYYFIGFLLWMILATPFSTWRGGSSEVLWGYVKSEVSLLFLIAGLTVTWQECKHLINVIALGGLLLLRPHLKPGPA